MVFRVESEFEKCQLFGLALGKPVAHEGFGFGVDLRGFRDRLGGSSGSLELQYFLAYLKF